MSYGDTYLLSIFGIDLGEEALTELLKIYYTDTYLELLHDIYKIKNYITMRGIGKYEIIAYGGDVILSLKKYEYNITNSGLKKAPIPSSMEINNFFEFCEKINHHLAEEYENLIDIKDYNLYMIFVEEED